MRRDVKRMVVSMKARLMYELYLGGPTDIETLRKLLWENHGLKPISRDHGCRVLPTLRRLMKGGMVWVNYRHDEDLYGLTEEGCDKAKEQIAELVTLAVRLIDMGASDQNAVQRTIRAREGQ